MCFTNSSRLINFLFEEDVKCVLQVIPVLCVLLFRGQCSEYTIDKTFSVWYLHVRSSRIYPSFDWTTLQYLSSQATLYALLEVWHWSNNLHLTTSLQSDGDSS